MIIGTLAKESICISTALGREIKFQHGVSIDNSCKGLRKHSSLPQGEKTANFASGPERDFTFRNKNSSCSIFFKDNSYCLLVIVLVVHR